MWWTRKVSKKNKHWKRRGKFNSFTMTELIEFLEILKDSINKVDRKKNEVDNLFAYNINI